MQFEVDDDLGTRFMAAIEKSGEEKTMVVERMFKTYVHEVFSRNGETCFALDPFLSGLVRK